MTHFTTCARGVRATAMPGRARGRHLRIMSSLLGILLLSLPSLVRADTLTTLYSFSGYDGWLPYNGLIQAPDGNFYGTTWGGGAYSGNSGYGLGTIFQITSSGQLTVLHSFAGYPGDGALPGACPVQGRDGNLYGTTAYGGAYPVPYPYFNVNGSGTVFKVTPSGQVTLLYSFSGGTDGLEPDGLIQGTDGNFYGMTTQGGDLSAFGYGAGTVFQITPNGTESVLHAFSGFYNADAGLPHPFARLIQATDGNFYGTTETGGLYTGFSSIGNGTIFQITPNGMETVFYAFAGPPSDGAIPSAGLIQGTDGNLYGTTEEGGAYANSSNTYGYGTVFKITPSGTETVLHSFGGASDGVYPVEGLILAKDGNFYGTTTSGGAYGEGTLYKITPEGTETVLHSFSGSDGANPYCRLIQGTDGNLYGTTAYGGASDKGTVFKYILFTYSWSGYLPPINQDGSSIFHLGRTVPVKFQLTGASAGITHAVARLYIAKVSGNIVGAYMAASSTSAANRGNQFRYDPTSGQYIFNLRTSGLRTGTYQLKVDLGDGVQNRTVRISLR